ncbi:MAG: DNA polymerase III subunit chi [Hellea sp.]|nr:DNA polymerase III subunit chi [Hellea sp.]
MTEYWFYHLETSLLEGVLPELLDKTRARNWRALVKLPPDLLAHLDQFLWTYKDDGFLPHGRDDEPMSDQQPILLSADAESSEGHDCAFLVDGAKCDIAEQTSRCIVMIDGRNEGAVQEARSHWKTLKDQGANLSYWQQNDLGRWEKKA